jgi:hypothetical protein
MASLGFQAARFRSPAFAKPTARQAVLVVVLVHESGARSGGVVSGGVGSARRHASEVVLPILSKVALSQMPVHGSIRVR